MGNSFGCSASGERLVSAARDGDYVEAKMLLDCNPCLAKYSTFGGLNSPLHFAAAKGHNEIVGLLLEKGADVNSRNYCGQPGLSIINTPQDGRMQADSSETTMKQEFMKTMRGEGVRGFYRGLLPNLLKVVPVASITYIVYEAMKKNMALD
ncbi:hypothetical protein F2Q68_00023125 [Brassica cretica]|uniref:PGG domain-containing protein n=1 Tax=Brassica cretica TaxID=69181 RepID=A0A8S9FU74_BRACR|nr:hypothetical protein F2Q68_00023125 [Brassica cretica]